MKAEKSVFQFLKYLAFSGLAAAANIGSRYVFSAYTILNYQLAIMFAYFIGMIINFSLNKNLNFPKGPRHFLHEARTFITVALVGLLLTIGLASLFLFLSKNYFLTNFSNKFLETFSHISAVGLVAIYSFFGHKYLTFRKGIRGGVKDIMR